MNAIVLITRTDALTARQILSWLARQAEAVQIQVMRRKHREFMRLQRQYVNHLRNALHRAMSWISPETQVKRAELPEIKEEWKRPTAPPYHDGRY